MTIREALDRLQQSSFRAKFHLSAKDIDYIESKGLHTIQKHAEDFVRTRLAPSNIPNDGKQTPMRGHPIFVAQHACACCCRGCLEKWYHIPEGIELSQVQQDGIVRLLMAWVVREINRTSHSPD